MCHCYTWRRQIVCAVDRLTSFRHHVIGVLSPSVRRRHRPRSVSVKLNPFHRRFIRKYTIQYDVFSRYDFTRFRREYKIIQIWPIRRVNRMYSRTYSISLFTHSKNQTDGRVCEGNVWQNICTYVICTYKYYVSILYLPTRFIVNGKLWARRYLHLFYYRYLNITEICALDVSVC